MVRQLLELTDVQRQEANSRYFDPEGWKFVESRANYEIRQQIRALTQTLQVALAHPDDEDCKNLLRVVKQV